jgi:integral membrane protein (TIGR01906 family)
VRVVEALVAGMALALLVVGLALYPMLHPAFTNLVSQRYSLVAQSGLPAARVLSTAEQVRAFVADDGVDRLPATVDGRPGFDAPAVSHLRDVRRALAGAHTFTGVLAALVAVWLGVLIARRRFSAISDALISGAGLCMLLVAVAALAGVTDFEALFTWFHGLFFSAGTWEFPAESLLIEVFPEGFWMAAGLTWAGIVLLGGAVLGVSGWLVRGASTAVLGDGTKGRRVNGA